jgi:hypothetical protein
MINKERTSAYHLFWSCPIAAIAGSTALWLLMGLEGIFRAITGDSSIAWNDIFPLAENILTSIKNVVFTAGAAILTWIGTAIFMLPFVMVISIPSYFLLRRINQLKLIPCLLIGVFIPVLIAVFDNPIRFEAIAFCSLFGLIFSSTSYNVLRKLSNSK